VKGFIAGNGRFAVKDYLLLGRRSWRILKRSRRAFKKIF
jgi:hypothetical protein